MRQRHIDELAPGAAGGLALRDGRPAGYLQGIGGAGGRSTLNRYGIGHMRAIGAAGGRAKRQRQYSTPATIRAWDGRKFRRVPYWPAGGRGRKRPIFVRNEIDDESSNPI
jgi:hypothetical protein